MPQTKGRPDADDEVLALRRAWVVPEHVHTTFHFRAGEDLDPRWAGYRVKMVLIPFEVLPLLSLWPMEIPPDNLPYVVLRWRFWKREKPGFLQVWQDRRQYRLRWRIEEFDPEQPDDVVGFLALLLTHKKRGRRRGSRSYPDREYFVKVAYEAHHKIKERAMKRPTIIGVVNELPRYISLDTFARHVDIHGIIWQPPEK